MLAEATRAIARIAPLLVLVAIQACNTVHLYDKGRDQQGIDAKKAWDAVDVKATIATERTNLAGLLAAELATQEHLALGIRDHTLRALIPKPVGDFQKRLQPRIRYLAGSESILEAYLVRRDQLVPIERNLDANADEFRLKPGLAVPECAQLRDGATPAAITKWLARADVLAQTEVQRAIVDRRRLCQAAETAQKGLNDAFGGALGVAWQQSKDDLSNKEAAQNQFDTAKEEFTNASNAYKAALAAAQADSATTSTQVKDAAANVQKAIENLQASGLGKRYLAQTSLDEIEAFFKAVATSSTTDLPSGSGAKQAATAFILVPQAADEYRAAVMEGRKALAAPLLLRKNFEQLRLEAATRDVEAQERVLRLDAQIFDSLLEQALLVRQAYREATSDPVKPFTNLQVLDISKAPAEAQERLYSALGKYLDAIGRLDARRYQLEYQRVAAFHDRALAYADVAAQQWATLIGFTIDDVGSYYASGIQSKDVTDIIQMLGVLWIGVGVNK